MILIHLQAKKLKTGQENPKNYPYSKQLLTLLKEKVNEPIVQIGIEGEEQLTEDFRKNLPMNKIRELLKECRTFISVDSFLQHLGWFEGKKGIVLWGQSDPKIFGHEENINLLKDPKYLRPKQFQFWHQTGIMKEAFVQPEEVIKHL